LALSTKAQTELLKADHFTYYQEPTVIEKVRNLLSEW